MVKFTKGMVKTGPSSAVFSTVAKVSSKKPAEEMKCKPLHRGVYGRGVAISDHLAWDSSPSNIYNNKAYNVTRLTPIRSSEHP